MLHTALLTPNRDMFDNIAPAQGPSKDVHRRAMCSFTVVSHWMARSLPLVASYPDLAVVVLKEGAEQEGLETVARHCRYVIHVEQMPKNSDYPLVAALLADTHWLAWPIHRLILFLALAEEHACSSARTSEVARKTLGRLPDEKLPEDCHQKVRDVQRTQRRKATSTMAVWDSCVSSGLLEDRSVSPTLVPSQATAEAAFRRQSGADTTASSRVPRCWSPQWNAIMTTRKDWTTLCTACSSSSVM